MSLQLILGSSGAGKSHYLYTHIIEESMKNPDRNYIVVVPEQYTMAIQKRLVSMHPRKGILNIDVGLRIKYLRKWVRIILKSLTIQERI